MTDRTMLKIDFEEGMSFPDFKQFKAAALSRAVYDRAVIRFPSSDLKRVIVKCIVPECPFHIRASYSEHAEAVIVRGLHLVHTLCLGQTKDTRYQPASSVEFLSVYVPGIMDIDRTTTAPQIVTKVAKRWHAKISYHAAYRCLQTILGTSVQQERDEFRMMSAYIDSLKYHDSDGDFDLQIDPAKNRFLRCFICPSSSRHMFDTSPQLIACDGTFTKSKFCQTLLIAAGLDGNGTIITWAWGVVESENGDSWNWFMERLRGALPSADHPQMTLISDREKGLSTSSERHFPNAIRGCCSHHLSENVKTKYGKRIHNVFWDIAKARTEDAFMTAMNTMEELRPTAAEYLRTVDRRLYARVAFPGRRYGQLTSNIVESVNASLKKKRELPMLQMLIAIWNREMSKRAQRLIHIDTVVQLAGSPMPLTPFASGLLEKGLDWATTYDGYINLSSRTRGMVMEQKLDGSYLEFEVNLTSRTCSCRRFQDRDIPCGHALAIIEHLQLDPISYMPQYTLWSTWKATYQGEPMPPILLSGVVWLANLGVTRTLIEDGEIDQEQFELENNEDNLLAELEPPLTRNPRGRPKKQRFRAGGEARHRTRDPPRCTTCRRTGHNARRCTSSHS